MEKFCRSDIARAVACLLETGSRKAIVYVSPKQTVKATLRLRPRANARSVELVLTLGRPNYAERLFIKDCLAAGEPFPVKRVQLVAWPKKRS